MTQRLAGRTKLARILRRDMTPAEKKLWQILRAERFHHIKFTRQIPIGPYIVDFVSRKMKFVIELDGDHHGENAHMANDLKRTEYLNALGYHVVRFPNHDVMSDVEAVTWAIEGMLVECNLFVPPLPNPLPRGEREH
jgi:very-short-patch-repair endonuclease